MTIVVICLVIAYLNARVYLAPLRRYDTPKIMGVTTLKMLLGSRDVVDHVTI